MIQQLLESEKKHLLPMSRTTSGLKLTTFGRKNLDYSILPFMEGVRLSKKLKSCESLISVLISRNVQPKLEWGNSLSNYP